MESRLILSRGGFPPLSARGCLQTLTPTKLGEFYRTVNGDLIYLQPYERPKYRSRILCEDKTVFASEGLWPGQKVTVSCVQRLCQKLDGREATLERLPVKGSIRAVDQEAKSIKLTAVDGRKLTVESDGKTFVSYCPILDMRVVSFQLKTDEWGVKTGWQLDLEEV